MPRVTHVKSARKDNQVCKKGESYYWWKFRYGGKRYSLTYPKGSQLTQSAYFGTLYSLQESIEETGLSDVDDWESLVQDVTSQLEDLGSETQDSLDNMPESLQSSPTGELLQERVEACESAVSDIECIDEPEEFEEEDFEREDFEPEDFDPKGYETDEEREEAEEAHDAEQDDAERVHDEEQTDLEDEHEQDQKEEKEAAFDNWKEGAKSELTDAIDQAVV